MEENIEYQRVLDGVVETMERFLESLHDCASPFEFASTLVKATAQYYKADIATLFRVSPSKTELVAEAGYDQKGQQLRAQALYNLLWDAKTEGDMPRGGLTAWVAVSGAPLFIRDAEELLNKELHPAHKGAWDAELHPKGPENSFGCLYAVPLRITGKNSKDQPPKESVLGVYKIERRQDNREGIFTHQQLKEFDLAAKLITLVILLYERAMFRILSDARHAVAGRLADAIFKLDAPKHIISKPLEKLCENDIDDTLDAIEGTKEDASSVFSWLRQALQTYSSPVEPERRYLDQFIEDTIAARKGQFPVKVEIPSKDRKEILGLSVAESWDLHTLLLSLINNAIQHSGTPNTVCLKVNIERFHSDPNLQKCTFNVSDEGKGISFSFLNELKNMEISTQLPLMQTRGTGLIRCYRVAKARHWEIEYSNMNNSNDRPGSNFTVTIEYAKRDKL